MKNNLLKMVGAMALFASIPSFAWDVEHDEIVQLTAETMPTEIRTFFTFDDFNILLSNCHYPDEIEWTHTYRTYEDLVSRIGEKYASIMKTYGYRNSGWFHHTLGRGVTLSLLARAFADGDHAAAAFFISVLSHTVSDESALNHPPLLHYCQYAKYPGVKIPMRKVEPGAKNVFGFRSDGYIVHRAREKLHGYQSQAPAGSFVDCLVTLVSDAVIQADYAARKEALIGFGEIKMAEKALADLVTMQVKVLENMIWTAWIHRATDATLPPKDFQARCAAAMDVLSRRVDPAEQGVFDGIFDETRNPVKPIGTIGLICDAYTGFSVNRTSYVGRMLGASAGRILRKSGYAVKGIRYFEAEAGKVPSPSEVGTILYFPGDNGGQKVAEALKRYRDRGGRLLVVGGRDPHNLTGFADKLAAKSDGVLPVSECWADRGVVAEHTKMSVRFADTLKGLGGTSARFCKPPNDGAFCKPRCNLVFENLDGLEALATLENGKGATFTIAARRANVTWLPQYLLMPYLFLGEQPDLDFAALTLDPFAEKLFLSLVAPSAGVVGAIGAKGFAEKAGGRREGRPPTGAVRNVYSRAGGPPPCGPPLLPVNTLLGQFFSPVG